MYSLYRPNVAFYIDKSEEKQKKDFHGVEVLSCEKAKERYTNEKIIVAILENMDDVKEDLISKGFSDVCTIEDFFRSKADEINRNAVINGKQDGYNYSEILEDLFAGISSREWFYHLLVWKNYSCRYILNPIKKILKEYMRPENKVADWGAGFGFWSLLFLREKMEVMAYEFDDARIETLRELTKYPKFRYMSRDIVQPYDVSNKYDVSFCANTLHVIPEWKKVLRNMCRETKDGGYVFLVATNPDCQRVKESFKGNGLLQADCTLEKIKRTIGGKLLEKIDITQMKDTEVSHYILLFQIEKETE